MSPRRERARRASGFTLVELLVTITVLTMLMSVAFGAVRVGQRSWQAGLEHAGRLEQLRATSQLLRRQIAQVIPFALGDGEDVPWLAFAGDGSTLRLVARAPRTADLAHLLIYEFAIEDAPEASGEQLVLYHAPFDPGSPGTADPKRAERVVLLEGFDGLAFDYFGRPDESPAAAWHETWSADEELLPELVRLRLDDDLAPAGWPELLVPVPGGGGA